MEEVRNDTLCFLGCGNLGSAILGSLLMADADGPEALSFTRFIACVRSEKSRQALETRFSDHLGKLSVRRGGNVRAAQEADVVILGVDPADVEKTLTQPGLQDALADKLLVSVAAGWTRPQLEDALYGKTEGVPRRARVLRTLPNIAALASQALTAVEESEPALAPADLELAERIFGRIGRTVRITPRLMDATTAVGGSTPAFFAVICDAMIDAAVAVGVPRAAAQTMIYQSMQGTAALLQGGLHPGLLKDQGTSPEGCTIGGLMVLEEAGVRGHVGRAVREAVTIAREMGRVEHVNDTRR